MRYINETHIYPGVIIIGLVDYIIHGAITGMTLVIPLLATITLFALEATLLALEVIKNKPHNR